MRILLSMPVLLVLTSCVSAPPPPPPVHHETPLPPVVALPPPAPLASDWRDWPQTPGDWRYISADGIGLPIAIFGDRKRSFAVQCDRSKRQVDFMSDSVGSGPITIMTSSLTRVLPTTRLPEDNRVMVAHVSVGDPLLDAIGFSRGRFVVEQPGQPPLVLPAWAEVERVVEDCRG